MSRLAFLKLHRRPRRSWAAQNVHRHQESIAGVKDVYSLSIGSSKNSLRLIFSPEQANTESPKNADISSKVCHWLDREFSIRYTVVRVALKSPRSRFGSTMGPHTHILGFPTKQQHVRGQVRVMGLATIRNTSRSPKPSLTFSGT